MPLKKEGLDNLSDNVEYYRELFPSSENWILIRYYFANYQFFKEKAKRSWFKKTRCLKKQEEFWKKYCELVEIKPRNCFV